MCASIFRVNTWSQLAIHTDAAHFKTLHQGLSSQRHPERSTNAEYQEHRRHHALKCAVATTNSHAGLRQA